MRSSTWKGVGRWGAFLTLAAALGVLGCGGGTATVSGKVYYKGNLLKGGNVTFVSPGNPTVVAAINEDGSYTAKGVPAGAVKICVETKSLNPAGQPKAPKYGPPPGVESPGGYNPSGGPDQGKRYVPIPESYSDPDQTDLTLQVTGGSMSHDIQLK